MTLTNSATDMFGRKPTKERICGVDISLKNADQVCPLLRRICGPGHTGRNWILA